MTEDQVLALQRRQHGVISRAQALEFGMTSKQIGGRVRRGIWIRQHRGVYLHAAVERSWRASLLSACMGLRAVASHRSAAVLHNI